MTILANHLKCDCAKVVKIASCPRPLLSPTLEHDNTYFHCPYCKLDYTCSQAIKTIHEKDKYGYPQLKKTVCRKCETEVERRKWPNE